MAVNKVTERIEKPIMRLKSLLSTENQLIREFLAEFFGTWVLVVFINGSVAQNVFFKRDGYESLLSVNLTVGFALTLAVLAVGKVSGGHLNPAVSLSMLIQGKLSLLKFFVYIIAQTLGAFIAAATVYATYFDVLSKFDNGTLTQETAGIFATYPHIDLSWTGALFDQTFGTTILIIGILSITDKQNKLSHGAVAGYLGILVFVIGTTLCYNCGYAVNPARDFGPRLFTYLAGWDFVFSKTQGYYFFLVPILGPMLGGILGTIMYYLLISNHWPVENNSYTLTEIKTQSQGTPLMTEQNTVCSYLQNTVREYPRTVFANSTPNF